MTNMEMRPPAVFYAVIELLFKRVASEVKRETKGAQEPWIEGGIEGDFMFVRQ